MYLKEIGKVPLLNAAQEVDLARRIEAGELSTALQRELATRTSQARPQGAEALRREGLGDPRPPAHRLRQGRGHRPRQDREELPAQDRRRAAWPLPPGRARRPARQAQADRGQPAPGGLDRQALRGSRHAVPRPDPGGQPRPDPRGREVRLRQGLQVLHLRHVVDPPGHHARDRRPGAHDPHPRAHGRDDQQARARPAPAAAGPRPRAHARRDRQGHGHQRREGARDPEGLAGAGQRWRRRSARRRTPTSATSSRTPTPSCRWTPPASSCCRSSSRACSTR